jgi:hypothetical protein
LLANPASHNYYRKKSRGCASEDLSGIIRSFSRRKRWNKRPATVSQLQGMNFAMVFGFSDKTLQFYLANL